jgi:hypothetical protein
VLLSVGRSNGAWEGSRDTLRAAIGSAQFCSVLFLALVLFSLGSTLLGKPGKVIEDRCDEIAMAAIVRRQSGGV